MTRTLVVGDVHGCARELSKLLRKVAPTRTVFVGDLFTKGPDPVGVWELVENAESVLGNHDHRLLRILAGKRPKDRKGRLVVEALHRSAVGWDRWLRSLPLTLQVEGWTVVHAAVQEHGPPAETPADTAMFERSRPGVADGSRWWSTYRGSAPVIFGHDAVRGRVRVVREGRPHIIGLDSGCVYGGFLSGYLIEADEIVSVRAKKVYCAVR